MLLKRFFIKKLYVLPFSLVFLLFSTNISEPDWLIVPVQLKGFTDNLEVTLPLLLLLLFSFIVYDRYELELSLTCGTKTSVLLACKSLTVFVYVYLSASLIIALYRYIPYTSTQYKTVVPIYVPDEFKQYLLFSVFITILFYSSLFLFIRIVSRDCYLTSGIGFFVYFFFCNLNTSIRDGSSSVSLCITDPFISTYILGNTVPNEFAKSGGSLSFIKNVWSLNRLIFLIVSLVLLYLSYLLVRREKIHLSFGE